MSYEKYLKYKNKYLALKKSMIAGNNLLKDLHDEIRYGTLKSFQNFLKKTKDKTIINSIYEKKTALIQALEYNKTDICKYLIDTDLDINQKCEIGDFPLYFAVYKNNIDIINKLISKRGIDIDNKNNHGRTALMFACVEQKIDIVKILLQSGANINSQDKNGLTAFFISCLYGYKDIICILLDFKANIELTDIYGKKPLLIVGMEDLFKTNHIERDEYASIDLFKTNRIEIYYEFIKRGLLFCKTCRKKLVEPNSYICSKCLTDVFCSKACQREYWEEDEATCKLPYISI